MESEEKKRSIRHIRLPVKRYTGERGSYWERKKPVEPLGKDYTDGVKEIHNLLLLLRESNSMFIRSH